MVTSHRLIILGRHFRLETGVVLSAFRENLRENLRREREHWHPGLNPSVLRHPTAQTGARHSELTNRIQPAI